MLPSQVTLSTGDAFTKSQIFVLQRSCNHAIILTSYLKATGSIADLIYHTPSFIDFRFI